MRNFCLTFLILVLFSGWATALKSAEANVAFEPKTDSLLNAYAQLLINQIIGTTCQYQGSPYQYGGQSNNGFDCSGLLNFAANKHGIILPRSSRDIARMGEYIGMDELMPGDFMFFKGRSLSSESVGHVALVTHHSGNETYVIHATTHGVMEEVIQQNSYFMPRLLFCKRIIPSLVKESFLN